MSIKSVSLYSVVIAGLLVTAALFGCRVNEKQAATEGGLPPAGEGEVARQPETGADWFAATNVPEARRNNPWQANRASQGTLMFPAMDPQKGDLISLTQTVPVKPGREYKVTMSVYDEYRGLDKAGRFEQHVLVNGRQYWKHDISGDATGGWMNVSFTFTTSSDRAEIRVETVAVGNIEPGWTWGNAAQIGVKDLKIEEVKRQGV